MQHIAPTLKIAALGTLAQYVPDKYQWLRAALGDFYVQLGARSSGPALPFRCLEIPTSPYIDALEEYRWRLFEELLYSLPYAALYDLPRKTRASSV